MDTPATRIISAALTMYDIMEQRVTIVEQLDLKRAPFPEMDVIYFCSPTQEAIQKIVDDFSETPRYGAVHLFFTDAVANEEFALLQGCSRLINRVKTLKELSLEFLAVEASAFHLDLKQCLPAMHGGSPDPMLSNIIARKLSTMCISLNEHPSIRYQGNSKFAKAVAMGVHEYIKAYKRVNPKASFNGDDAHDERERGQLLVLDRCFDPVAPLMHEYTYQAMVYDLLNIEDDSVIEYFSTNNSGQTELKKALLGEHDDLWVDYRHQHIAKVIDALKTRMKDIVQNNAGAALAKKSGADMKITAMADAVKSLPEYQQIMARLAQHVAIAQLCMDNFADKNQKLIEVAELEQKASTGYDDNNSSVSKSALSSEVSQSLSAMKSSQKALKKRLAGIYVATQQPVTPADKQMVIQAGNLSAADQQFIENLDAFCKKTASPAAADKGGKGKSIMGSFFKSRNKQAEQHRATAEGEYVDSRFQGALKGLMEQLLNSDLPVDKYPAVGPSVGSSNEAKSAAKSVRRFGANNRWNKKESNITGGRYMCFVAGGITHSELRAGYELQTQHSKEVICGSSHFISSGDYIGEISKLNA
jgi:hypothetical protein